MKSLLLLLSLILLSFSTSFHSQKTIRCVNKETKEAIPFPKLILNGKAIMRGDMDGILVLPNGSEGIVKVSAFEFRDTVFMSNDLSDTILNLRSREKDLGEAVIVPKDNPAHRIIDLVAANRKENDPMRNDEFRCYMYSKFHIGPNRDTLAVRIKDAPNDSIRKNYEKKGLKNLFVSETYIEKGFTPPSREKETVLAYKASGFEDPIFSMIASQLQAFSFYDNQFKLLDADYLNPLVTNGKRKYLFILTDTMVQGADTTFGITFRPRKSTTFKGLEGVLYINTKGFAVEKVIAKPYTEPGENNLNVRIVQEYIYTNDKKWFPKTLGAEVIMPLKTKSTGDVPMECKSFSIIKDVAFNLEDYSVPRDNYSLDIKENANVKTETDWEATRGKISEIDQRTYIYLDSVSKQKNTNNKIKLYKSILTGKFPIGIFNLDMGRLYRFNRYEGSRFGIGLETNKKVFEDAIIGGYVAFGTKDKNFKFGGFTTFRLDKKHFGDLQLSYIDDVAERGVTNFETKGYTFGSSNFYRLLFSKFYDQERRAKMQYSFYAIGNVQVVGLWQYQRITSQDGYFYNGPINTASLVKNEVFDNFSMGLELNWRLGEKAWRLGGFRYAQDSKYPMFRIAMLRSMPDVLNSQFDFWRFAAEIEQTTNIKTWGKLKTLLTAGKLLGSAPLFYNFQVLGTGGNGKLSVTNTFETVRPGEFFNSEQVALFVKHTFPSFGKRGAKWRPNIAIHHGIGYGSMSMNRNLQKSKSFSTMDKGLFEGGIILQQLINIKTISLGFGVFYRYGEYSSPKAEKNITFKIALSTRLPF